MTHSPTTGNHTPAHSPAHTGVHTQAQSDLSQLTSEYSVSGAVTLPLLENTRLGRKVNFAPGKTTVGAIAPKNVHSVPAQEMHKHRAKFGRPMKLPARELIPCASEFCLDEWQDIWDCCEGNKLHLWSPYGIGRPYIFSSCFFLSSFFFPRLISAVGDWMSTILRHMVWS